MLPTPGEFDVRVCPECGTGKTFPIVAEDELGAFYEGGYGNYIDTDADPSLLKRLLALPRWIYQWRTRTCMPISAARGPGRMLDIGCGNGWVCEMMKKHGWDAVGIEPSPVACAESAARGVEVHEGTINTVELPEESFDAVLFYHSLEHTVDPRHDLRRARGLLKTGGQILIAVPNFGSPEAKKFGTAWHPLELPRHRTHFTQAGLEELLKSEGFSIDETTTGTPLLSYLSSLQIKRTGSARPRTRLGGLALSAVAIPLQPITAFWGKLRGGRAHLNVAATKLAA